MILDFDDVPGPYRFDPRDGELAAIYCRTLLPRALATLFLLVGRCRHRPASNPVFGLKLAFWLDQAVRWHDIERHLNGCPIDSSTLRPVQPIYVARPILVDVDDPIGRRSGFEEDIHDAVAVPALPAAALPSQRKPSSPPPAGAMSVAPACPWPRSGSYALCGAIERAGVGGRHRCLIWAAARAVELDDALPREHLAAGTDHSGPPGRFADSDADLQRQVRNGFRIGIFGAEAPA